jgi:glycosyltransferase involved in cell wall biosynthesis
MSYILITPIKDEENYFHICRDSVLNQTIKPLIWVIVDSGSTDRSYEIATELAKKNNWIHIIKQKEFFDKGYSHLNFAGALQTGYDYVKKISNEFKINYKYIGKVDATNELSNNYFQKLIEEIEKDSKIAIICGIQYFNSKDRLKTIKPLIKDNFSTLNDIRLYRKEFLEEIKGFPISYSPDTVLSVKARLKGWKTLIVKDTYFVKHRLPGAKV